MLRLEPMLSRLSLVDKDFQVVRFPIAQKPRADFAWAQRAVCAEVERQYNAGLPVRVIVLKARQLGMSTLCAGIGFLWSFIHPNTSGLIIAHENRTASSLFEKTQFFWDSCPWHDLFVAKHATQRRIVWEPPIGSGIDIASAVNLKAGVGRTLHMLHISEAGLYPEPEILMVGLRQTMPNKHGTIEIVESTARGVGNWFHQQWIAAVEGESQYVPLFFPWFKHYEYQHNTVITRDLELDEEERRLRSLGAPYEAIQWRRFALPNLCNGDEDYFRQEYPATADEAFITSGRNIFPPMKLLEVYEPMDGYKGTLISEDGLNPRWVGDPHGKLTVFAAPTVTRSKRADRYFIGADPSRTTTGDPACIQVISRETYEQVAVWHGNEEPNTLARMILLLGRWYHDAELCPEVEGGGQGVIALLRESGYPNLWRHRWADRDREGTQYGFSTNFDRKHWAIGALQHSIYDGTIRVHDQKTFHQLQNYVQRTVYGDMGPSDNAGHDDAVMALAIAVFASHTEPPFVLERQPAMETPDIYAAMGQ